VNFIASLLGERREALLNLGDDREAEVATAATEPIYSGERATAPRSGNPILDLRDADAPDRGHQALE
jgi:hypothetical protein